jgi:hypothetical protein
MTYPITNLADNDFDIFTKIYDETKLLDIACNSIMVKNNIRPTFLIQSINYGELENDKIAKNPKTTKILSILSRYFEIATISNEGFIISNKKIKLPNRNEINSVFIGNLIGYPCSGDLDNNETRKYGYHINVSYKNNEAQLMAVVCRKNMDDWFENKVNECQIFFDLNIFNNSSDKIKFNYKRCKIYNDVEFIDIAKSKKDLSEEEQNEILNLLWNHVLYAIMEYHKQKKIDIFKSNILPILIYQCVYDPPTPYYEIYCKKSLLFQKEVLDTYFNIKITNEELKEIYAKYDHGRSIELS